MSERTPTVTDIGPDAAALDDMRAFLLRLADAPIRVCQTGAFPFQWHDQLNDIFDPWPVWFEKLCTGSNLIHNGRLNEVRSRAEKCKYVVVGKLRRAAYLQITPAGRNWLRLAAHEQFMRSLEWYRAALPADLLRYDGEGDSRFLGTNVTVIQHHSTQSLDYLPKTISLDDRRALRHAVERGWGVIPMGAFLSLDNVLEHFCRPEFNPLLLGQPRSEVAAFHGYVRIPDANDEISQAGRKFVDSFICKRMIPLGCCLVGIAHDKPCDDIDENRTGIFIAKQPRLAAYFGREVCHTALSGYIGDNASVVVQADFSVIFIGTNAVAAAELAPMCDVIWGSAECARSWRITKESIKRAVACGLDKVEIMARLHRHSKTPLPATMKTKVEDWCGKARS